MRARKARAAVGGFTSRSAVSLRHRREVGIGRSGPRKVRGLPTESGATGAARGVGRTHRRVCTERHSAQTGHASAHGGLIPILSSEGAVDFGMPILGVRTAEPRYSALALTVSRRIGNQPHGMATSIHQRPRGSARRGGRDRAAVSDRRPPPLTCCVGRRSPRQYARGAITHGTNLKTDDFVRESPQDSCGRHSPCACGCPDAVASEIPQ